MLEDRDVAVRGALLFLVFVRIVVVIIVLFFAVFFFTFFFLIFFTLLGDFLALDFALVNLQKRLKRRVVVVLGIHNVLELVLKLKLLVLPPLQRDFLLAQFRLAVSDILQNTVPLGPKTPGFFDELLIRVL